MRITSRSPITPNCKLIVRFKDPRQEVATHSYTAKEDYQEASFGEHMESWDGKQGKDRTRKDSQDETGRSKCQRARCAH